MADRYVEALTEQQPAQGATRAGRKLDTVAAILTGLRSSADDAMRELINVRRALPAERQLEPVGVEELQKLLDEQRIGNEARVLLSHYTITRKPKEPTDG